MGELCLYSPECAEGRSSPKFSVPYTSPRTGCSRTPELSRALISLSATLGLEPEVEVGLSRGSAQLPKYETAGPALSRPAIRGWRSEARAGKSLEKNLSLTSASERFTRSEQVSGSSPLVGSLTADR